MTVSGGVCSMHHGRSRHLHNTFVAFIGGGGNRSAILTAGYASSRVFETLQASLGCTDTGALFPKCHLSDLS